MFVAVMDVRVVRMGMRHCRVEVRVAVGFPRRVVGTMCVLMVFVMDMAVFVEHLLVFMHVFMALRQVEQYPDAHERGRCKEDERESLSENEQR